MGMQITTGTTIMCTFGTAPSCLTVLPTNAVMATTPAANIMDGKPFVNVPPFAMCVSPSNPAVAAALGVPQPCVPVTPAPWIVGKPTVLLGNMPTLDNTSTLMCTWGGVITIAAPGQFNIQT